MATFPIVTGRTEYDSDSIQTIGPHFPNGVDVALWDNGTGAFVPGGPTVKLYYARCGKFVRIFVAAFDFDTALIATPTANLSLRTLATAPQLAPINGRTAFNIFEFTYDTILNANHGALFATREAGDFLEINFVQLLNGIGPSVFFGAPALAGVAHLRAFQGSYAVIA